MIKIPSPLKCLLAFVLTGHIQPLNAAPSSGCGNALASGLTPGGASQNRYMILSNGVQRTYKLYIPTNYVKTVPAPIIISYHGRGESGAGQEAKVQLSNSGYNKDYIVVYPDGLKV